MTVLFADLKGSMELLADRDPEEARKLLDPVLEHMMEAVHRYEGTVNQVMGDGIMALFGAPLAHEDHAVRACYAALRMRESVRRYAEEMRRSARGAHRHPRRPQLRRGGGALHRLRPAYGLHGRGSDDPPGGAHGADSPFQAPFSLLAPRSPSLRATSWSSRSGPVPVKGLADPIDVFELTGVGAARTRLQAGVVARPLALRGPRRGDGAPPSRRSAASPQVTARSSASSASLVWASLAWYGR